MFYWLMRWTTPLGGVDQARSVKNTHTQTHTEAALYAHTGLEGKFLMPNVPFAVTDGSFTFLGEEQQ